MKTWRIISHRRKTSPMEQDGLSGSWTQRAKSILFMNANTHRTPGSIHTERAFTSTTILSFLKKLYNSLKQKKSPEAHSWNFHQGG